MYIIIIVQKKITVSIIQMNSTVIGFHVYLAVSVKMY